MKQSGKTIKQIADEIGVSKQAITYRLKQFEAIKENGVLATKENGVLVVSLAGEKLLKSAFTENSRQTFGDKEPPKGHQKENDILVVLQATIETLQKQLEIKDKQVSDLTDALKAEQEALRAEQTLHAETKGMLQTSEKQLITESNDTAEDRSTFRERLKYLFKGEH